MMRGLYILDTNRNPVPVGNGDTALADWSKWFEDVENRRVADTPIDDNGAHVSTVFLGMDHGMRGEGKPVLFETLVFGGALDGDMWRYCTWDEAEAGHAAVVAICQAAKAQAE
jgi:hypothetical protein